MSFLFLTLGVKAEEDFAPNAKSAILVDNLSGKVLYEKNADEKLAPASMTKLASMLMVMEAIDNGNLKFEPYNMTDREGRLSKQSIHLDNTYFYDVSITGIYSKKYKL